MVYSLTYRRPSHVTSSGDSINGEEKPESYTSGSSGVSAGIPDALSFDNIINNGTCPVCECVLSFRPRNNADTHG